ncbi:hypothetical protein SAMN05421809_3716 [Natronorubrum daqingense]|uniref:Uncharacterized protein n=1 Tax=Natronorubrum daqingense TaxID=588898 RepID=A0A1N7G4H4_9EURY|nr:hypothetical protein SAMN05421809_3716 [Natronorubrum daqingense]
MVRDSIGHSSLFGQRESELKTAVWAAVGCELANTIHWEVNEYNVRQSD